MNSPNVAFVLRLGPQRKYVYTAALTVCVCVLDLWVTLWNAEPAIYLVRVVFSASNTPPSVYVMIVVLDLGTHAWTWMLQELRAYDAVAWLSKAGCR